MTKFSICGTVYNSKEFIKDVIESLLKQFPKEDGNEIVIVDGGSTDGTYDILKKYSKEIVITQVKCFRGKGRDIAINLSKNNIIVNIDLDNIYINLKEILNRNFEQLNSGVTVLRPTQTLNCIANIICFPRDMYSIIGPFPNLNVAEDVYFIEKAKAYGAYKELYVDLNVKCLALNNKGSGIESRYETSFLKKIKRRIVATRDALFVNNYSFGKMVERYQLNSFNKIYIGIPLYIIGNILKHFIKVPKLENEIKRLREMRTKEK